MVMRHVTEFNFDPNRSVILGAGATYQVSKTTVRSFWEEFRGENNNYIAAVKFAKVQVGRSLAEIGTNEAECRRLRVILFELDVLSRPGIRQHPNIASLMGFSWDETDFGYAPCLVMELATKGTARDFTSSQTLSNLEKVTLCRDVACGLHFLHSNNIVHGDVKQDNILIYEDKSAPVGFVAKVSDLERSPQSTEPQTYTGTTLYNAPEVRVPGQNSADKDAFWLCDVFSFGLLAFEVISGRMFKQILNTPGYHEHQQGMDKILKIILQSVKMAWEFSEDLRHICRYILEHTVADDPSKRIPLGWSMILNILPYNDYSDPNQEKDVVGVTHDNIAYSVLEIHAKVRGIFKERLGDAMWFDLDYTAKNAQDPHQRGNAAFNLFLLYSLGRFGPYKDVRDALVLLNNAAKCQYVPAFVVGMRIYEATGLAGHLPDIFHGGPELTEAREAVSMLYGLPSDEFYSSAVQIFWTAKLELDLNNRLNALFDHHGFEPTFDVASEIQNKKLKMSGDELSAYANTSYLLHHCVAHQDYLACETLLQAKCDINARIPGGMAALHLACRCANSEIIKLLLQYDADPTINDEHNISPLHWLVLLPKDNIREVAESLFAKCGDAKIEVASTKSRAPMFFDDLGLWLEGTPMQWAIDCYNFTAIQVMLGLGFIPSLDKRWPKGYLDQALGNACAKSAKLFLELRDSYSEKRRRRHV